LNYSGKRNFTVAIIEIMLPVMDGWTLAQNQGNGPGATILFLSAKSMVEDKIKGLSIGADDYITKPFSIDELALRMEVFLERSNIYDGETRPTVEIGKSVIDFKNQCIHFRDKDRELTQRENELLRFLIGNAGRVVKREEILKEIWGDDNYFLGRSLDVFISRLRKIMASEPAVQIQNIHGVGFRCVINI
jgi:DNA-binding response OmpR family regulator